MSVPYRIDQTPDSPPGAARPRIPRFSRRRLQVAIGLATLVLAGVNLWIMGEPYRVRDRFVRAMEIGDARTMIALTDPDELRITGLTEEGLRRGWQHVFPGRVRFVRYQKPKTTEWYEREQGRQLERFVAWADAATGQPIPAKLNAPNGDFQNYIVVHHGKHGWKVRLTAALLYHFRARYGDADHRARFLEFVEAAEMRGLVASSGEDVSERLSKFREVVLRAGQQPAP